MGSFTLSYGGIVLGLLKFHAGEGVLKIRAVVNVVSLRGSNQRCWMSVVICHDNTKKAEE